MKQGMPPYVCSESNCSFSIASKSGCPKSGLLLHLVKQPYMEEIIGAEAERKKCVEAKKCHLEWGENEEKSQRSCDREKMQKKGGGERTLKAICSEWSWQDKYGKTMKTSTKKDKFRGAAYPLVSIIWRKGENPTFKNTSTAARREMERDQKDNEK